MLFRSPIFPRVARRASFRSTCRNAILALVLGWTPLASAQLNPLQNQAVAAGATATFTVTPTGTGPFTYQWQRNGVALPGATGATLTIANVQPEKTGVYTVAVTAGGATSTASATLGLSSTAKFVGQAIEYPDILHPTGKIYDQILLQGPAATITADAGQVTRISYVDFNHDIVQVEFAGAGSLSLALDDATGPAAPGTTSNPTSPT